MKETRTSVGGYDRKPLPAGTVIEFCGEKAVVAVDYGGNSLVVEVPGEGRMTWYWKFDGAECQVVPSAEAGVSSINP